MISKLVYIEEEVQEDKSLLIVVCWEHFKTLRSHTFLLDRYLNISSFKNDDITTIL